jgi:hypothetical protein
MAQEVADGTNGLEQLKRRFEEFRSTRTSEGRLPDALWKEAAEVAKQYGANPTAQALGLDYNRLKKHMAASPGAKRRNEMRPRPAFMELIGPVPGAMADCHIEVESDRGAKLRLELKGVATTELANLIRGFLGH